MHQLRHIVIATKYIAIKMGVYQKDNTFDNKNSYAARRGFISVCYLASHEVYREIIVMRGYQDALSKFATCVSRLRPTPILLALGGSSGTNLSCVISIIIGIISVIYFCYGHLTVICSLAILVHETLYK